MCEILRPLGGKEPLGALFIKKILKIDLKSLARSQIIFYVECVKYQTANGQAQQFEINVLLQYSTERDEVYLIYNRCTLKNIKKTDWILTIAFFQEKQFHEPYAVIKQENCSTYLMLYKF